MTPTAIFIKDGEPRKITLPEKLNYESQEKKFINNDYTDLCENLRHCQACRILDKAHIACVCDEEYQAALDRAFEQGVKFEESGEHLVMKIIQEKTIVTPQENIPYHVSLPDYKEVRQYSEPCYIPPRWKDGNPKTEHPDEYFKRTILRFLPQEPAEEKDTHKRFTCNADCSIEYGECCHPSNCIKVEINDKEEGSDGEDTHEQIMMFADAELLMQKSGINEVLKKFIIQSRKA